MGYFLSTRMAGCLYRPLCHLQQLGNDFQHTSEVKFVVLSQSIVTSSYSTCLKIFLPCHHPLEKSATVSWYPYLPVFLQVFDLLP